MTKPPTENMISNLMFPSKVMEHKHAGSERDYSAYAVPFITTTDEPNFSAAWWLQLQEGE